MKICSICKVSQDKSCFHKNKSYTPGLDARCKLCKKKTYLETSSAVKERTRLWKENNVDKKRLANKNWAKVNRQYYAAWASERRASKLSATVSWDKEFSEFVLEEAFSLAKLRFTMFNFKWHVDHIVPLRGKTICGLHVWNNLQVIPAITNMKKGNRWI